jgi:broad specificity phosphatase PhoE
VVSESEWINIDWLEEARMLLDWLGTLDSGPVLIMVRHSERLEDIDVPTTIRAELTESGHDIASEFGKRLPKNFRVTIFHSPHIRTKQTAERIAWGLQEKGGILIGVEQLNILLGGKGNIEEIVTLAHEIGFDEFYWRWKRNGIPLEVIEPIGDYLERLTQQVTGRFHQAETNDLHIHVTHDTVIAASRSTYLEIAIDEGLSVPFLGGYGIAKIGEKLVGFKGGKRVDVTRNFFS